MQRHRGTCRAASRSPLIRRKHAVSTSARPPLPYSVSRETAVNHTPPSQALLLLTTPCHQSLVPQQRDIFPSVSHFSITATFPQPALKQRRVELGALKQAGSVVLRAMTLLLLPIPFYKPPRAAADKRSVVSLGTALYLARRRMFQRYGRDAAPP